MNRDDLIIIKNRSDIGAGTRGADLGIDAMEIAAINAKNDFFNKHPHIDVDTHNETIYNKVKNPFAKRINHVAEQCERVCEATKRALMNDQWPLVLSGDHSSALGTISGIKAAFPQKRLGVIWIDAHADLHSPYTSPSGNVHGMPLAAALGLDNLGSQVNEVTEESAQSWERLKTIGIEEPKVQPKDLIFFGVRDTEAPEDALIKEQNIKNYTVEEYRYRGFSECVNEAVQSLKDCDLVYISFDVDSMDCDRVSYGTGTPVQRGFDPHEVVQMIRHFMEHLPVKCLEVVEVNPLLDFKGNKMAEVAFDVIRSL
jgi:arginase